MATHRIDLLPLLKPDSSGNCYWKPSTIDDANDRFVNDVLAFKDSSTKVKATGSFTVPKNWVSTDGSKIVVIWKTTATSGNLVLDFDYKAVAVGESLDPSTDDETLTVTDAAAGTARLANAAEMPLDETKLAVDDIVLFALSRDSLDAADTLTGVEAHLVAAYFEYLDV